MKIRWSIRAWESQQVQQGICCDYTKAEPVYLENNIVKFMGDLANFCGFLCLWRRFRRDRDE